MTRDLMYKDEIQQMVAEAYRALDSPAGAGTRFYSEEQLAVLPAGAREWALGVGNPVSRAQLRRGEVVVDLGCGAGIDAILASQVVGSTGRVFGVELLPEMAERANTFASDAGAHNVDIKVAEMEELPLPDESVDVVISNGAINLSARKSRVLAEAHRVLRAGGRMCVTDLTLRDEQLPSQVLTHPSAWAG